MWGQDEHTLGSWLHSCILLWVLNVCFITGLFLAKWKLQAPGFTQMALKDSAQPTQTSQHHPHSSPPDCTAKSPPSLNSYVTGWCLHCRKKAGFYTSLSEVCITSSSGHNKSSQARLTGLSSARSRSLITGDWKEQSAGTQTFRLLVFPFGEEGQDTGLLLFRRRAAARAQRGRSPPWRWWWWRRVVWPWRWARERVAPSGQSRPPGSGAAPLWC